MTPQQQRWSILSALYQERGVAPRTLYDNELEQRLDVRWSKLSEDVDYLAYKEYVTLKKLQRGNRQYSRLQLTPKGIDLVEGRIDDEAVSPSENSEDQVATAREIRKAAGQIEHVEELIKSQQTNLNILEQIIAKEGGANVTLYFKKAAMEEDLAELQDRLRKLELQRDRLKGEPTQSSGEAAGELPQAPTSQERPSAEQTRPTRDQHAASKLEESAAQAIPTSEHLSSPAQRTQDQIPALPQEPRTKTDDGAALRPADFELRVTFSSDQQSLSFTLHNPAGVGYFHTPVGSVRLTAPPRDLLQRTFDRLSDLGRKRPANRTPDETRGAMQTIADIGSNLYDELFPPELKREYRILRNRYRGGSLVIISDEPWIPWEIIRPTEYDPSGASLYDDPPLSEMFELARWSAGREVPQGMLLDRAVLVQPPDNLQGANAEAAFFSGLNEALPGIRTAEPLQALAGVLDDFRGGKTNFYHFACHGNFDLTDPNESKLKLSGGFLTASQITGDRRGGLLRARPLVFLNACHSGERGYGLTRLGGWAQRFVDSGATAFIGSLWEINDALAARFAIEFYDRLLGLEGHPQLTLGKAFREARLAIKALDPANPTWLAYVLYGNPNAQASTGGTGTTSG